MAAVPLSEYMKNMKPGMPAAIIDDLIRKSMVLQVLPFRNIDTLSDKGARWQGLPTSGKRKLNGAYTPAFGTKEEVVETLFIYGGEIQIDRILTKSKALFKPELDIQVDMLTESVSRTFNYDFMKGDHGVDPDGMEGLYKRVGNMAARYTISLESGGATLDVLASSTNVQKFLDAMHKASAYIGGADVIFCNETGHIGVGQALRRSGLLSTSTDAYGRVWDTLDLGGSKPKLIDVGLKTDLSTEIIPLTEGTDSGSTSFFACKMGEETGLNGLQLNGTGPEVYDPLGGGELSSTPGYLRRIDWACVLKNVSNNFSIARVTGVKFV